MAIDWMAQANALQDDMVARRRDFHQHPELAFEEIRTAGIVAQELNKLGLEVTTGVGKTGVVAILEGNHEGPTVMVRCDMDALPVTEQNKVDYISQTPGKMHACGHDGHTTIALTVARLLAAQRTAMAGRIKFIFQPAEETALGAAAMLKDGVLNGPRPDICLGLHLWTPLPYGEVAVMDGPSMAGADDLKITIRGSGGHGAIPDQTRDPIVAGAQIVTALQSIVGRNVSPLDTAVVSITTFHAGETTNVIPPTVTMTGTFRTFRKETHDLVERRIREIVTGIATAMGCEAEVESKYLTLPVVNSPEVNARLRKTFSQVAPKIRLRNDAQTMGAEDMSMYLNEVPGSYFFVGAANSERGLDHAHHSPQFDFEERALPLGAALLASAVADYVLPG